MAAHQADRTINLPRATPSERSESRGSRGAILLMTVFIIALGTILVIGFLQLSLADLQIVRNHQYSVRALYIADAGIEDALYELGQDKNWDVGFTDKAFAGETYTVTITNNQPNPSSMECVSTVDGSFQRRIEVQSVVSGSNPPTMDYWKEI